MKTLYILVPLLLIPILVTGQFVSVTSQEIEIEDVIIDLNIVPSTVESTRGMSTIGFVNIVNAIGLPVPAPRDLEIAISSQNVTVARVPSSVMIPKDHHYSKFDIRVGEVEGEAEIFAIFQNQLVTDSVRVTETRSIAPEDMTLRLHIPTNDMLVNSEMPISVFLESGGSLLTAPEDMKVSLTFEKSLIDLEDDRLVIKKGSYYGLTTVRTLEQEGTAFIRATTEGAVRLSASSNIRITSNLPAALNLDVFPIRITLAESSIDVFVGLYDPEGRPTFAREDITVNLFSNSTLLSDRFQKAAQARDFTVKKGEFGLYARQEVFFDTADENILVGASAQGLKSSRAILDVLPVLFDRDPKTQDETISVYTPSQMPTNAEAITVYQILAIERNADDCPLFDEEVREVKEEEVKSEVEKTEREYKPEEIEELDIIPEEEKELLIVPLTNEIIAECSKLGFRNIHHIDLLDERDTYPFQSETIQSKEKPIPDLFVTSSDDRVLKVDKIGKIAIGKSYGTAFISSKAGMGPVTVTASVQGVGSGSASINVASQQMAARTLIFSPTGEDRIGLNREGTSDLFVITLDVRSRPVSTMGSRFLVTPLDVVASIEAERSFSRLLVESGSIRDAVRTGSLDAKAIPVGVEARTELEVESTFDLIPYSGTSVNIFLPFQEMIGFSRSNPIGVVQLTDTAGRPVLTQNNLIIKLDSSNSRVIQVPPTVTIPEGRSFVEFAITTSGKAGSATVTVGTEGLFGSQMDITSVLRDIPATFIESMEPYEPTVENNITISTLQGVNVLWAVPEEMEVVKKDDRAVTFDEETESYLANLRVLPQRIGNFTVGATLLNDGYQTRTLSQFVLVEELPTRLFIFFEFPEETIPFNETRTIQIFVDNEKAESVPGALVSITPVNATAGPRSFATGADGGGIVTFRATGPGGSMSVVASKEGYKTGQQVFEVAITGLPGEEEAKLFGLPSWVIYAGAGGAAGGVVLTFMILLRGKKRPEEEEEEI